MSKVTRNVAANIVGTAMLTLLTLIITPMQISILGIEAFGILGFVLTLQMALAAFDFGLAATLTREIAADQSLEGTQTDTLIRTSMTVYWAMAVLLGLGFFLLSDEVAQSWFKSTSISHADLAHALQVIAIFLALRWPISMYVGILTGLQRMDILNVIKVATLAIRLIGGVVVLLHWRTLEAFLWWTVFNAFVEVIVYDIGCRRVHTAMPFLPGFSTSTVRRVWRFSATMNALAILAVLLTQVDRIVISKTSPLEVLGYYNLAYTVASMLTLLISAIGTAALPWFTEAHAAGNPDRMRLQFLRANWMTLFVTGMPAGALVFFGGLLLTLWVNAKAAGGAAPAAAVLAGAFWVSAVVSSCYNVVVAQGSPRRPLIVGALSVGPYFVIMYFGVREFGAVGAAGAWLLLQLSNAVFLVPHILSQRLGIRPLHWALKSVVPIFLLGLIAFGLPRLFLRYDHANDLIAQIIALIAAIFGYLIGGYLIAPGAIVGRWRFPANKVRI